MLNFPQSLRFSFMLIISGCYPWNEFLPHQSDVRTGPGDRNDLDDAGKDVCVAAAVSWGHFVALPLCVLGQFSRITSAVMRLGRHQQTCSRGVQGRVLWTARKGFQPKGRQGTQ